MTSHRAPYSVALLAGLSLVGALTGCSAAAEGETPAAGAETDSGSETQGGDYADGTYEASAEYPSPNVTETLTVTVTLAEGVITDVEAIGDGDNPNSKRYQAEFSAGIADVVVGKSIDEIQVDKVAGSSLTSEGFNKAIEEIKADAAS
jgi:uncharacterized protein with FMN-binding domain